MAPYPLVYRLYGWFSYSCGCLMKWFGYGCGRNCMDDLIMEVVGHYMDELFWTGPVVWWLNIANSYGCEQCCMTSYSM